MVANQKTLVTNSRAELGGVSYREGIVLEDSGG